MRDSILHFLGFCFVIIILIGIGIYLGDQGSKMSYAKENYECILKIKE